MSIKQLSFLILIFLVISISLSVNGQSEFKTEFQMESHCVSKFDTVLERTYYIIVDKMPTYRGGSDTLLAVIRRNLKWSGPECCIVARVFISLIIETDGRVTNKRIIKSYFKDDDPCSPNDEALNVIDCLTDWNVGKCNGENVAVQYIIPISFIIE